MTKPMTTVREASSANGCRKKCLEPPWSWEMGMGWDGGGLGSHKEDYTMGALLFFNADLGKIKGLETKYSRSLS